MWRVGVRVPADQQNKKNEKEYNVLNDTSNRTGAYAPAFTITGIKSIMDKKLIERFGQDILSYRLRTARQRKRAVYEDFDKYLMQLDREESILWKQKFNLGWEPLIPAVQRGWVRSFVLREDVAKGSHAQFFAGILGKINSHEYSHRKDFRVKKRRMGRRVYVARRQVLKELSPDSFHRKKFTEEEKTFFQLVEDMPDQKGHIYRRYVFREPWRFVLKVRPNIVDKVRIRDIVLEQRLTQIRKYLDSTAYLHRQMKLVHGSDINRMGRNRRANYDPNPIKSKPLHKILEEAKEEIL